MLCRAPHGARGLKWSCVDYLNKIALSRPAWGAWIEMSSRFVPILPVSSRPAWGAWIEISMRAGASGEGCTSRPAWGAWIEIESFTKTLLESGRRAPHGARGLKSYKNYGFTLTVTNSRAPHGARGLKLFEADYSQLELSRAPHGARGLKLNLANMTSGSSSGRAPHGARGLKSVWNIGAIHTKVVAPRMGRVD